MKRAEVRQAKVKGAGLRQSQVDSLVEETEAGGFHWAEYQRGESCTKRELQRP